MNSSISIEDVNSIFITENSEGRIGFIFKSEDDYIYLDCNIPANPNIIFSSERPESSFISQLNKKIQVEAKYNAGIQSDMDN